ncbi:hypothetical protein HA402_007449 [Bradysia odoriphaga]|nr:hypothetical protein HA402_007449 [Bradysia odoriphaga]
MLLGLQLQTIESIRVFERMQTPFIVVLNKLDKLSNWQTTSEKDAQDALENQTEATRIEFHKLIRTLIHNFRIVKRDACLYYNASSLDSRIYLVPTSAKTGEGIENLLHLIVKFCQRSSVAQRLRNRNALLTNVYRKDFIDGIGSSADCLPYNPKIQKVKGVHSIKVQTRESDNTIEIEEIKSVHTVKVQPRERENAIDIEEVKGIQSVKIRAREDASANSNFNIAWGTDFYRRLFRINMKLPQIKDNRAKKKKERRDAWLIAIDTWVGIMTLSVFVMMIIVFVHYR